MRDFAVDLADSLARVTPATLFAFFVTIILAPFAAAIWLEIAGELMK